MVIENWFIDMPWDQWLWYSCNLFSNSYIKMRSKAACFSVFIGLCLVSVLECKHLFAINWACTAPCPPCALFSAHAVQFAHWCYVVAEQCVHFWGQARLLDRAELVTVMACRKEWLQDSLVQAAFSLWVRSWICLVYTVIIFTKYIFLHGWCILLYFTFIHSFWLAFVPCWLLSVYKIPNYWCSKWYIFCQLNFWYFPCKAWMVRIDLWLVSGFFWYCISHIFVFIFREVRSHF